MRAAKLRKKALRRSWRGNSAAGLNRPERTLAALRGQLLQKESGSAAYGNFCLLRLVCPASWEKSPKEALAKACDRFFGSVLQMERLAEQEGVPLCRSRERL